MEEKEVTVIYRKRFYVATYTKDWKCLINDSKGKILDITNKKKIVIPDWLDIVTASIFFQSGILKY